jgi:hypothetical protein
VIRDSLSVPFLRTHKLPWTYIPDGEDLSFFSFMRAQQRFWPQDPLHRLILYVGVHFPEEIFCLSFKVWNIIFSSTLKSLDSEYDINFKFEFWLLQSWSCWAFCAKSPCPFKEKGTAGSVQIQDSFSHLEQKSLCFPHPFILYHWLLLQCACITPELISIIPSPSIIPNACSIFHLSFWGIVVIAGHSKTK